MTWAFEWDQNIASGGSLLISKDKKMEVVPVPPSAILPGLRPLGSGRPALEKQERKLNQFTGSSPAPRLLPARGFYLGYRLPGLITASISP